MTVAQLLDDASAAHATYRRLAANGRKPDGWRDHLWDALTMRERAHEMDPRHADPAWSAHPPHEPLVAFYRRQLGLAPNK